MHRLSRGCRSAGRIVPAALAVLVLAGSMAGGAPADEETEKGEQVRKQRKLERRIAVLEREQDLLLFRRVLLQSDSKYLLLDLSRGNGKLLYRNRVLRTFRVERAGGPRGHVRSGRITLSGKRNPYRKDRQLIFGSDLVLQATKRMRSPRGVRRYVLDATDLAALTYALERGARAFILP